MNHRYLLALSLLPILLLTPLASAAQTGSISGTVIDENGDPVANAAVTLQSPPRKDAPQKTVATAATNEKGEFTLDNLPPIEGYVISAMTKERWGSKDKINVKPAQTTKIGNLKIVKGNRL